MTISAFVLDNALVSVLNLICYSFVRLGLIFGIYNSESTTAFEGVKWIKR